MKKLIGLLVISLLVTTFSCKKQDSNIKTGPQLCNMLKVSPGQMAKYKAANAAHTESGENVIYLNFSGGTCTNANWCNTYNGGSPIVYSASSFNSTSQQAFVDYVKERYCTYNVIVTLDPNVYANANQFRRIQVNVTPTDAWYGTGAAYGVGWFGSFMFGDGTDCWIFENEFSGSTAIGTFTAAHEVGHTLGLYHQSVYDGSCNKTSEYRPKDCSQSPFCWGPIMGSDYTANICTFTYGPSGNSCAPVDEYSILLDGGQSGVTQLSNNADDASDDINNPTTHIRGTTPHTYYINTIGDVDCLRPSGGALTSYITVVTHGTLDIAVECYDVNGVLHGTLNPSNSTGIPRTAVGGPIQNWVLNKIKVRPTTSNGNIPAGSQRGSYDLTIQ